MSERFKQLWDGLGCLGLHGPEFQFLCDSYSQPGRFYHNLDHVEACLDDFREVADLTDTPELVELAIWYHDVIYDVNRNDNELKSADVAAAVCSRVGLCKESAKQIHDLILITKHDRMPESINQKIIVDVDLAVLGKPWQEYDKYRKAIRREYAHVADGDFRKGRIQILRSFLEKPSLYSLDCFKGKYYSQAVENIQREISELANY